MRRGLPGQTLPGPRAVPVPALCLLRLLMQWGWYFWALGSVLLVTAEARPEPLGVSHPGALEGSHSSSPSRGRPGTCLPPSEMGTAGAPVGSRRASVAHLGVLSLGNLPVGEDSGRPSPLWLGLHLSSEPSAALMGTGSESRLARNSPLGTPKRSLGNTNSAATGSPGGFSEDPQPHPRTELPPCACAEPLRPGHGGWGGPQRNCSGVFLPAPAFPPRHHCLWVLFS